ncbi:hypothetical protein [Sorangium sp. So ce388]|uniref:hypothetical protein n=1 Tax=Sorangium sp. So ce388 TaxID=3133309 RepID=UPI003F5C28F6
MYVFDAVRVGPDGTIWMAAPDALIGLDPEGHLRARIQVPRADRETCGAFAVLDDGFVVALYRGGLPYRHRREGEDLTATVLRLDEGGGVRWATPLAPISIESDLVVEISTESGGKPRRTRARRPRAWIPSTSSPLLVSGGRVLASFCDMPSTGMGCAYGLDLESGRLIWQTPCAPTTTVAIAAPGRFLIGHQGYGALDTHLYDGDGRQIQRWRTHGCYIVGAGHGLRLVEQTNDLSSEMRVAALSIDGEIQRGPLLGGYATCYPALTQDGVVVFWREGALLAVDRSLRIHRLGSFGAAAGSGSTNGTPFSDRMLLAEEGTLVFIVGSHERDEKGELHRVDTLWIVRTDLGPLCDGPWPCRDGGAGANPVK